MLHHPLAPVLDRIEPEQTYTTADLSELLDMSTGSIRALTHSGWLPGSKVQPHARGGRRFVWTGQALLEAAEISELPALDHDRYHPSTLWRLGCGCHTCLAWHNTTSRKTRRRRAEQALPADLRAKLLRQIRAGTSVKDASLALGTTHHAVYGLARTNDTFARELDDAAQTLCAAPADSRCGTAAGYSNLQCRATHCRRAHAPTT